MSFQNQGFWMAKGTGSINTDQVNYDNSSRSELKRSHQWFMDAPEVEPFPNKKQAAEVPTNNFFTELLHSNVSPWGNAPSFQSMSTYLAEQLFNTETTRTVNFDERNMPSIDSEKVNMERKVSENQFENPSSSLSMSCTLQDPRLELNFGGIRRAKVSQIKDTENVMPLSMVHAYNGADNSSISTTHTYKTDDEISVSTGNVYNKGDGYIMPIGETYERENNSFISMGQPYSKEEGNISMSQMYKGKNNTMEMSHTFSKGENIIGNMVHGYKAEDGATAIGHIYNTVHDSTVCLGQAFNKGDKDSLSVAQSYNKGVSTMISFGGYDDDDAVPSGGLISSYDLLMAQHSHQTSEVINKKELIKSNFDANVSTGRVVTHGGDYVCRKKEDVKGSKKLPANNFPSNVRSLLSTGMLDGVAVKYIAWSREKELRGVIKGSGYLCGCQSCNFSKVINAYEFERHANCKTKHPNNHIYFENGRTIYGIVQELRSTPQNVLFDVIQTITGSPINQKSFQIWKESFIAATQELQLVYEKDERDPL